MCHIAICSGLVLLVRHGRTTFLEEFKIFLLNQVHAGHRPAYAWFLKIVSEQTSTCVRPPLRLLITSAWQDMDPI